MIQAGVLTGEDIHFVQLESDRRIFYQPGARDIALKVSAYLPGAISKIEKELSRPFMKAVRLYVFRSDEDFALHTGVSNQEWGVMMSEKVYLSGIIRKAPDDHIKAILTHELVHLYLLQRLGWDGFNMGLPIWFKEGLAELISGGTAMVAVSESAAAQAILSGKRFEPEARGRLLPPEQYRYGLEPHMFYRQTEMFVAYLKSIDEKRFRAFILAVEDSHDFEGSFGKVFGFTLFDAWQQFVRGLKSYVK
ncbi:MAG: basic secretory protein-like protein [Nitrospirota bacterium]